MCALTGRTQCRARALSPGLPRAPTCELPVLDAAVLDPARTQSLVVDPARRGIENHSQPPIGAAPAAYSRLDWQCGRSRPSVPGLAAAGPAAARARRSGEPGFGRSPSPRFSRRGDERFPGEHAAETRLPVDGGVAVFAMLSTSASHRVERA